jgi:hypothetical protein
VSTALILIIFGGSWLKFLLFTTCSSEPKLKALAIMKPYNLLPNHWNVLLMSLMSDVVFFTYLSSMITQAFLIAGCSSRGEANAFFNQNQSSQTYIALLVIANPQHNQNKIISPSRLHLYQPATTLPTQSHPVNQEGPKIDDMMLMSV